MHTINAKELKTFIRRAGGKGKIIFSDNHAIIVAATNGDSYLSIPVESGADAPMIAADLALLTPLLKQFDGEITLHDDNGQRISINDGSAFVSCEQIDLVTSGQWRGQWLGYYDALVSGKYDHQIHFYTLKLLRPIIASVSQHMAVSDARYCLNGAMIQSIAGRYRITATDGHRLYSNDLPHNYAPSAPSDNQWIIPSDVIMQIKRCMVSNKGESVTLHLAEKTGLVQFDDGTQLAFNLVDAKYPDCNRVIPSMTERSNTVTIDRKQALKTVKGFYDAVRRTRYQGAKVTVNGSIALEHDSCEVTAAASIPYIERSDAGSDDYSVGLNAGYLLDALQAIDSDIITLGFDPKYAHSCSVLITGDRESLAVVMPMRL